MILFHLVTCNFSALILQIVSHSWCSIERQLLFSGPDGKFRAFKGSIQNPPEQTDLVVLHTEAAEHMKQRPSFCSHRRTSWSFGLCEEGLNPYGCALPVGQRCSMLQHLREVALAPCLPTDPFSFLWTGQGAKQRDHIPTFHPNTESRRRWARQQDPGVKQYSGSDCINTVSIKSVLFAFAAVTWVSENLTVPGTVWVQNKLTPI